MRKIKMVAFVLLTVLASALAGCGGSSTTANPFPSNSTSTGTAATTDPIFGSISTATGKIGITLKTDRATVDVDNGQVLVTAKVVANDSAVAGVPVTFSIVAPANGTANIEAGRTTVTTDSNGEAVTRITTTNVPSTTNVLVAASATIGTRVATANTSFQVVRGGGVIMFSDKAGLTSGGQSNLLTPMEQEVLPGHWFYYQLIPFKVTDSNGNPRVGVPVTASVYSITTLTPSDVTVDFLVPPITEPNQQTITTDSAGQGIFNATIDMGIIQAGQTHTVDVVFKAVTNDSNPVTAYVGNRYTLSAKAPTLTISPSSASFGTATEITFTIAGGTKPYSVSSNKTGLVTATLKPDGVTVSAQLVDPSAWTDSVIISVTDSGGQSASSTVTRGATPP